MADSVALVVAGGSGIGADAARKLSESGYRIGVMSASGKGEALGNELGGLGYTGSNLEPDDLSGFVAAAMARFGRIDGVVNCAGHGPKGEIDSISDDDWHLGMDCYLLNVIRMARLVTPVMLTQGSGSIVNISTFAAFEPDPAFPTSAVFRAGLAGYTKLYSDRYAANGVRMKQCASRLHRQSPGKGGKTAADSGRSVRCGSRAVRGRRLSRQRRVELHHRPEHSCGRRTDRVSLTDGSPFAGLALRTGKSARSSYCLQGTAASGA